jgi:hypothetical protein
VRAGFLLAEDEALKTRFSNLTVSDDRNASRPVQVFFRYPEGEVEKKYPFITIELLDIIHATDRQHSDQLIYGFRSAAPDGWDDSNPAYLNYWPDTHSDLAEDLPEEVGVLRAEEFVPVNLLYQVATYTRSVLHDRQLTAKIMSKITPFRRSFLDIEADGTRRNLFMLDYVNADLLDQEAGYRKRAFRKVFTYQLSAEIPSTELPDVGIDQVSSVLLTYKDKLNNRQL